MRGWEPASSRQTYQDVASVGHHCCSRAWRAPGFASPLHPNPAGRALQTAPGPEGGLALWRERVPAVASVVVISVSLCSVAACPPSLLLPVVQDLEVSRLLFSSPILPAMLPTPISQLRFTLLLLSPAHAHTGH